jgi:HD-like signal output (HDOD) protein
MDKQPNFSRIAAGVGDDGMHFPTSARLAMTLRAELDRTDCQVDTAVKLVRAEPLLCARIIAMANAAAFNPSGRNTTDVHTAITRLGFQAVRSLAMAHLARQLAGDTGSPTGKSMSAKLWEHTAHVASLAHLIARRVTHVDPDAALFAGIVHTIGGFYLLSQAAAEPRLLTEGHAQWLDEGRVEVGRAVLRVLKVPEAILSAIEIYWDGYLTLPPHSLGDTLLLADELSPVPSPFNLSGSLKPDEDGAPRLDMLLGKETLTGILADARADVDSLLAALLP